MLHRLLRTALPLFLLLTAAVVFGDEVQVAFDHEGQVNTITPALEQQLQLFPEIEGFLQAQLFTETDSTYIVEILYRKDDQRVRARRRLSASDLQALRDRVSAALQQQAQIHAETAEVQDSRSRLLIGTSLLGLGFYGWGVPAFLEVHDGRTAVALYMLDAGASFYVPYWLTKNRPVDAATSRMALWGGTRGIVFGIAASQVLDEEADDQFQLGMALTGSVAGLVSGYTSMIDRNISPGRAEAIGFSGDVGLVWGFCAGALGNNNSRTVSSTTLLGGAAGLYTAAALINTSGLTVGDVRAVQAATVLGGYGGLLVWSRLADPDAHSLAGVVLTGSALGLAAGSQIIRDTDFTPGQGIMIDLGTLAGGLVGMGLAYIIEPEFDRPSLLFGLGTVGGIAGLHYTQRAMRAQKGDGGSMSFDFQLHPEGLLTVRDRGERSDRTVHLPLATMSIRF